jgi:hypothetical protein
MEKILKVQIWVILLGLVLLSSCLDPPEYSKVPKIKFNSLKFEEIEGKSNLVLAFNFEDGDGNIGFYTDGTNFEISPPYQPYYEILYYDANREWKDSNGNLGKGGYFHVIENDQRVKPPFYAFDSRGRHHTFSETDNRSELDCEDYIELSVYDGFTSSVQKIVIERNVYHSNLILTFYKRKNGEYYSTSMGEFRFPDDKCQRVLENLRIPIFDIDRLGKATVGKYIYSYESVGLKSFLALDTFKLSFFIYDRDLNKSNVVETRDFVLSDIAQ